MRVFVIALLWVCPWLAFSQISKNQLFELVEKGIDQSVIVSMVQTNCVDFELTGSNVVELSQRVTPEVLRVTVDCIVARDEKVVAEELAKLEAELDEKATESAEQLASKLQSGEGSVDVLSEIKSADASLPTPDAPGLPSVSANKGDLFQVPSFVELEVKSNKSTYDVDRVIFQIEPQNPTAGQAGTVQYQFSGDRKGESTIRCYQKGKTKKMLAPGEYVGYLYVKSSRKVGITRKSKERTDLHKFFIEYKGPGPITIEYLSREKKMFKSSKSADIEVHGPVSFFGEEHMSVEGDKTFEELRLIPANSGE